MRHKSILVVTDNHHIFREFRTFVSGSSFPGVSIRFCCTSSKVALDEEGLTRINVKKEFKQIQEQYDLVISLHCKQIFPAELVQSVRCINVHPGLNPFNRGWYPQVFSIINKLPIGATIHEMDEKIDHGAILVQQEVEVKPWDTSLDVYNRVVDVEMQLIRQYFSAIVDGSLQGVSPESEGNYNGIEDFENLRKLDLGKSVRMGEAIDYLRALTHGNFDNAFFVDPETGKKVFVRIHLKPEND